MDFKSVKLVEAKAEGGAGGFTALASVFGNVDKGGDRMMKGAFTVTLQRWRASGKPIPIILSHQWDDPMKYIGKADPHDVVETDRGLMVQGTLDTSDPIGEKVYRLMKERLLTGWSFGYTIPKGGQQRKNGVNEVFEVDLFETGPTLVGMNSEAELQDVKSALVADDQELEIRSKAAAEAALAATRGVVIRDRRDEMGTEILDALRAEWEAKRAVAEEELVGSTTNQLPLVNRPPTRIWMDTSGKWHEEPIIDEADIHPGVTPSGRLLPSERETQEAKAFDEKLAREAADREAERRQQ